MKITKSKPLWLAHNGVSRWKRVETSILGISLVAASAVSAWAAPATTNYTAGDLLIGFRLSGDSDNLVVNLGSIRNYVTSSTSSSGLWDGALKQIQFGIVPAGEPNAGTAVYSLSTVLTQAYGSGWATNDLADGGADVSWAVAGTTSATNSETLNGFNGNTNFITKAETTLGTTTSIPANTSTTLNGNANARIAGIGSAFNLNESTLSLNTARISADSETNSWSTNIGTAGVSNFAGAWVAEQDLTGSNAGPTNSILDLILDPRTGNPTTQAPNTNLYLGSFRLTSDGSLYYGSAAAVNAVPEPSSYLLLVLGAAFFGFVYHRNRSKSIHSNSTH